MKVLIISGTESTFDEDEFYSFLRKAYNKFITRLRKCISRRLDFSVMPTISMEKDFLRGRGGERTITPALTGPLLGGVLYENGIDYDMATGFFLDSQEGQERIQHILQSKKYDVIGISTTFITTNTLLQHLINIVKRVQPNCKIVVGGHLLFGNDAVYLLEGIDYYVIGDGENAFPELIKAIDNNVLDPNIKGVMRSDYIVPSLITSSTEIDLNDLPLPAWDKYLKGLNSNQRDYVSKKIIFPIQIETTRGCAYRCSYCNYWANYRRVRFKSAEKIIQEMILLYELGVRKMGFWDSSFTTPKNRLIKLIELIEKQIFHDVELSGFAMIKDLDIDLLTRMEKVGFNLLYFGIESGNDGILKKMRRNHSVKDVIDFFYDFNNSGLQIEILGSFIIGFPGETIDSISDSINLIKQTRLKYANIQQLWIKQGSDIHSHPENYGLSYDTQENLRYSFSWKHETMNSSDAARIATDVFYRIHFETSALLLEPLYCLTDLSHLFSPINNERNFSFLRLIQEGIAISLKELPDYDTLLDLICNRIVNDFPDKALYILKNH
ncbi:MAG: radical SAM protein [Anaerolineales bacterium]|jgi:radical SAM superfamily enzyme YgiQ (UPF0313 family)